MKDSLHALFLFPIQTIYIAITYLILGICYAFAWGGGIFLGVLLLSYSNIICIICGLAAILLWVFVFKIIILE